MSYIRPVMPPLLNGYAYMIAVLNNRLLLLGTFVFTLTVLFSPTQTRNSISTSYAEATIETTVHDMSQPSSGEISDSEDQDLREISEKIVSHSLIGSCRYGCSGLCTKRLIQQCMMMDLSFFTSKGSRGVCNVYCK